MELVGLVIVLFASAFVVIVVVTLFSFLKGRQRGISKDEAERIVLRRYAYCRTIGARFAMEGGKSIWEFDIRDGEEIHRVCVNARTGSVIKSSVFRSSQAYRVRSTKMLGNKIG